MSVKKILAISLLMAIMLGMNASACTGSSCPCVGDDPLANKGLKAVGVPICVQAPLPPSGETWSYEFMIYDNGVWRNPTPEEQVTPSKVCVTPTLDNCGEYMAVRVTIQTTTGDRVWANCILELCIYWTVINPTCPTMTDFCEGEATDDNLPDEPEGPPSYDFDYSIDGGPVVDTITVAMLNALSPGQHVITVYTKETGNYVVCTITITVAAKPTGSLNIVP